MSILENKISHWQQQIDSIATLIQSNIAIFIKSNASITTSNIILQSENHANFPSDNVLYNQLNNTIMLDKELNKHYAIQPIIVQKTNVELGYIFIEKSSNTLVELAGIMQVLSGYIQFDLVVTQTPQHLQKASYGEFIGHLHRSIMHAKRAKGTLSVFYLEIDKTLSLTSNKEFQHKEKDDCIETLKVMVEQRLQDHFRAEDIVMHLYNNTFAAILVDFDCESHLLALANRQQKIFDAPFAYYGEQVICTTDIGCSFYPQDGDNATTLFTYAEEAGKNAIKDPRIPISIYNERIGKILEEDLYIQNYLRNSSFSRSIILKEDNICYLDSNQLESIKLKLEIDVPELGVLNNKRFLNVAIKNGLMYDLWLYLLREAIKQAQVWLNTGRVFNSITLHVEEQQLLNPNFIADLEKELSTSQFDPSKLNIVITEEVLLNNQEKVSTLIQQISAQHVLVSLSNIKTYISRTLIQELPVHQLHIFADIVNEMPLDDKAEALFDSVITAGKQLGLGVIATGIENEDQTKYLIQKGCQLGLGSLYKNKHTEMSYA